MDIFLDVSTITIVIGALVGIVNLLTQVIKKLTWDKIPSSLLAFVISQVVTLLAFFAYISIKEIQLVWYFVVGAILVGFMVSYAAMFGYDKFVEILQTWGKLKEDQM